MSIYSERRRDGGRGGREREGEGGKEGSSWGVTIVNRNACLFAV